MKTILIVVIFLLYLPIVGKTQKRLVFNDSKNSVTMTPFPGGTITFLESNQSAALPDTPISYLMTLKNSDSTAVIMRNGFVIINEAKDTIFVSKLKTVDCYWQNNSFDEISIDYGVFTVFIPSGATRKLDGLVLDPEKNCFLTLRNFINGDFGKPETKEVSFKYQNGRMLAKQ